MQAASPSTYRRCCRATVAWCSDDYELGASHRAWSIPVHGQHLPSRGSSRSCERLQAADGAEHRALRSASESRRACAMRNGAHKERAHTCQVMWSVAIVPSPLQVTNPHVSHTSSPIAVIETINVVVPVVAFSCAP